MLSPFFGSFSFLFFAHVYSCSSPCLVRKVSVSFCNFVRYVYRLVYLFIFFLGCSQWVVSLSLFSDVFVVPISFLFKEEEKKSAAASPPPIFLLRVVQIGEISTVFVSGLHISSGTILSLVVIPLGRFPLFPFCPSS